MLRAERTRRDGDDRSEVEALLAAIVTGADDAIITTDRAGCVTSINPAGCELLGYEPPEILGQPIWILETAEPKETIQDLLLRVVSGEHIRHYRTLIVRKNHIGFPASVTLSPVASGNDLIGVSAMIRDVTREVDAERARALLAALVSSSHDAIFSRLPDGTVTSWNESARLLFGFAEHEMVGRNIEMIVPVDALVEFHALSKAFSAHTPVFDRPTVRLAKDGRRVPVSVSWYPIVIKGVIEGVATVARDLLRTAEFQRRFRALQRLTDRERQVLELIAEGLSNCDIAVRLELSEQTVKNYVSHTLTRLDAVSRTDAAAIFLTFRASLDPENAST